MFRQLFLGAMAFVATSAAVAVAAPKDDLTAAAQKLADAPNYSWSTTSANAGGGGGFGGGTTTGKAEKDGFTMYTQAARQTSYDIVIKGDKVVVKTDNGWELASDLAKPDPNGGGGFNPGMMVAMRALNFKSPITQAQDLVGKVGDVAPADDALSADLTADQVKDLATAGFRPRNPDPNAPAPTFDVTNPKGSVKFWMKDGVLTKMELHLQYSFSFNGGDPRDIDRTTTTEFTDVGSTTVTVPDEAKAKLGS